MTGIVDKAMSKGKRNPFLSFPQKPKPHSILFIFKEYDYNEVTSSGTRFPETLDTRSGVSQVAARRNIAINKYSSGFSAIELPFPRQLSDNTSLNITNFERGIITETIAGIIGKVDNVSITTLGTALKDTFNTLKNFGYNTADNIIALFGPNGIDNFIDNVLNGTLKGLSENARFGLRNVLPGDIARNIDAVLATKINPRESLAFDGVNLASHSFSWELYPSNEQESQLINQIVRAFKSNALPTVVDRNVFGQNFKRVFLNYPATVEIRLLGISPDHFVQFKPCMIKNVNVNYGSGGSMPLVTGGRPGIVSLSVDVSELQIRTAEDYYPFDDTIWT